MHHCLTIEEILSVIFAYTDPKFDGTKLSGLYQTDFDTLRTLAVTCKTFRAPALDRLWYTQWGLENLVALLPVEQMDIGKPLKPEHWDRFDAYARRIRRLEIARNYWNGPPYSGGVFPSRAVMEIFRHRGKTLLPRLKSLVWDSEAVLLGFFQSFDLFLGPSVIDLDLSTIPVYSLDAEPPTAEDELDLAVLPSLCPTLKEFKIRVVGTPPLISQLRSVVASFQHLKTLECAFTNASLSFDLLLSLSTLPMLEDLSVRVYSSAADGIPMMQPMSPGNNRTLTFPALDNLSLVGDTTASCAEVLRITNLPTMKSLYFESALRMALRDALVDINANCSPTALQELVVVEDQLGYVFETEPAEFARVDGLKLLQKFRNLTLLTIGCPFDFTDADMKNLASWWPQLIQLQFPGIKLQLTMNGVLALVKGCPRLEYFTLVFLALQPTDFDPKGYRNERIRSFAVSASPVEGEPQAIANRLVDVFPALETVDLYPYDMGPFPREKWGMVQSCLPTPLEKLSLDYPRTRCFKFLD